MKYYFTKSKLPGSRLIQWGTGADCSHFAVGFGRGPYSHVIESTLLTGVRPTWEKTFLAHYEIAHCLEYSFGSRDLEHRHYQQLVDKLGGKSWDWKGVSWLAVLAIGNKMGIRVNSEKNQWADKNSVYCVEVLKAHEEFLKSIKFDITKLSNQMLHPHEAYVLLKATGAFKEISWDLSQSDLKSP